MTKRRPESFADTVARVKAQPKRPHRVSAGRLEDVWGDPAGVPHTLVEADLAPADALALASRGARVVFDACGCGGSECQLDWLSDDDVRDLAAAQVVPTLHPSKNGRADLEHWRSDAGRDLVVAAVDVSWGDRIRG